MTTIMINSRAGDIEGKRNKEIAFSDKFDPRADKIIRHFILFKYGVMLRFEPFGWKKKWYIDFIDIEIQTGDTLIIKDVFVDDHLHRDIANFPPKYILVPRTLVQMS